jgi:hypothetical protein
MHGKGVLTGAIFFVGGPKPLTPRPPEAGWVHIVDAHGKTVRRLHVRRGRRFRVTLPAGMYKVEASQTRDGNSLGCGAKRTEIRGGRETRVTLQLGCLVP